MISLITLLIISFLFIGYPPVVLLLTLHLVHHSLGILATLEQLSGTGTRCDINGVGWQEVDVRTLDVACHGELLHGVGSNTRDTDLERAEAIQLYGIRLLQLILHHLDELSEHRLHVRLLHRTVALDDLCEIVG